MITESQSSNYLNNTNNNITSKRMFSVMSFVKKYCEKIELNQEQTLFCINEAKKKLRDGTSAAYSIFFAKSLAKKIKKMNDINGDDNNVEIH